MEKTHRVLGLTVSGCGIIGKRGGCMFFEHVGIMNQDEDRAVESRDFSVPADMDNNGNLDTGS